MAFRTAIIGLVRLSPLGAILGSGASAAERLNSSLDLRVIYPPESHGLTIEEYITEADADGFTVRSLTSSAIVVSDQGPAWRFGGLSYAGSPFLWTKGQAITSALPTVDFTPAVGGFSFNGTPPTGISINANTGALTGTPTVEVYDATFRVRSIDDEGKTHNRTIRYSTQYAPSISYVGSPFDWTEDEVITPASVTSIGGQISSFSVIGSLPAGVALNTSTGQITGTPTGNGGGSFTVRATGPTGLTDDAVVDYDVAPGGAVDPPIISYSDETLVLPIGVTITPIDPTEDPGSGTITSYACLPLPSVLGLTFSTVTGRISGIPTTESG